MKNLFKYLITVLYFIISMFFVLWHLSTLLFLEFHLNIYEYYWLSASYFVFIIIQSCGIVKAYAGGIIKYEQIVRLSKIEITGAIFAAIYLIIGRIFTYFNNYSIDFLLYWKDISGYVAILSLIEFTSARILTIMRLRKIQ